jgi:maleamate amidohydrolase
MEEAMSFGRFSRADIEELVGYRMGASARVGFGERPALVIVDMSRDVVKRHPEVKKAAMQTRPLLEMARKIKIPVFFTRGGRHYHSVSFAPLTDAEKGIYAIKAAAHYREIPLKEEDFQVAEEIGPEPGEVVITKPRSSAFFGTFLESLLNWHRVDTLIITGMSTTGCHRATVQDAFFYNYKVVIPEECVAGGSGPASLHYISLLEMDKSRGDVMPLAAVLDFLKSLPSRD